MIAHDCTRQFELVSFIEQQQPSQNSGFYLDTFFTDRRTQAEKLEVRKYSKQETAPLFYTGACLPPTLIKGPTESLSLLELTFPTIKAETSITGCDVDERRILPDGTLLPVGMERYNEAYLYQTSALFDGLRATHSSEAITLMKTGGYVLRTSATETLGTIDYGRAAELANIDLTGTNDDWSQQCSRPMNVLESIMQEMGRYGGIAGVVDIIYGAAAWRTMEAHDERNAIKYDVLPTLVNMVGGVGTSPFTSYSDVQFKGTTNGGQLRHWVNYAQYLDHTGTLQPVLAPGEIMIVSGAAFGGQRVFRTLTSDGREFIPAGALPYFLYDDLDREYNRKCRSFNPWIEEYHLMVPANVNGAALVRVTDDAADPCVACEDCP